MSDSYRRGETSEIKVGHVLNELQASPEVLIEKGIGRILRIFRARPNSKLDRDHVDFLVLLETVGHEKASKIPVPIQVKRSERHRRSFETEMDQQEMPHLRAICAKKSATTESICEQVIRCLHAAINAWKDGLRHLFKSYYAYFIEDRRDEEETDRHRTISSKEMRRRKKDSFFYFPMERMSH